MICCYLTLCVLSAQWASWPETAYPIQITVRDTWQVDFAPDVQDLAFDYMGDLLIARSNGAGRLYMFNTYSGTVVDSLEMPPGVNGFGATCMEKAGENWYFVAGGSDCSIHCSDGNDSWTSFPDPAGAQGSGIDCFADWIMMEPYLYIAAAESPWRFYILESDSMELDSCGIPGIQDEIGGFMVHEVFVENATQYPFALIVTTRYAHEFHFYWLDEPSSYIKYGQEDCPIPVLESLGICWSNAGFVYWSYMGIDGLYYISELEIPVFGGIDGATGALPAAGSLRVAGNPSRGSAALTVTLNQSLSAELKVYDICGRMVSVLQEGEMGQDSGTFTFTGPAGIYTAVLETGKLRETARFVLTE